MNGIFIGESISKRYSEIKLHEFNLEGVMADIGDERKEAAKIIATRLSRCLSDLRVDPEVAVWAIRNQDMSCDTTGLGSVHVGLLNMVAKQLMTPRHCTECYHCKHADDGYEMSIRCTAKTQSGRAITWHMHTGAFVGDKFVKDDPALIDAEMTARVAKNKPPVWCPNQKKINNEKLEKEYSKLLEDIGHERLLSLPVHIKDLMKRTTKLATKVELLTIIKEMV